MSTWNTKCGYDQEKLIKNTFIGKWASQHVFSYPAGVRGPVRYMCDGNYNKLIRSMTLRNFKALNMQLLRWRDNRVGHWSPFPLIERVIKDASCLQPELYFEMYDIASCDHYSYCCSCDYDGWDEEPPVKLRVSNPIIFNVPNTHLFRWLEHVLREQYSTEVWSDENEFNQDRNYMKKVTRGIRNSKKQTGYVLHTWGMFSEDTEDL